MGADRLIFEGPMDDVEGEPRSELGETEPEEAVFDLDDVFGPDGELPYDQAAVAALDPGDALEGDPDAEELMSPEAARAALRLLPRPDVSDIDTEGLLSPDEARAELRRMTADATGELA